MRRLAIISLVVVSSMSSMAWENVLELEAAAVRALTPPVSILEASFTNEVSSALQSTNRIMRVDAELLQSIINYQRFLDTVEGQMLDNEFLCLSNVVSLTSGETNRWQFWTGRLLLASTYAAGNHFDVSYQMSTNYIQMAEGYGCAGETNALSSAILTYYEMPGIEVDVALKVFAGMSAAGMGSGTVATNFANQVPAPYRNMILEFVK